MNRELTDNGINLSEVMLKLQDDGVAAFAKSYDELMKALSGKRTANA